MTELGSIRIPDLVTPSVILLPGGGRFIFVAPFPSVA